jgi:hypothetical protein
MDTEKYEQIRQKVMNDEDKDTKVLWWNPSAERWQPIAWKNWVEFGMPGSGSRSLESVPAGDHRFAVCIIENDKYLVNFIPHRYVINGKGEKESTPTVLTPDQKVEWNNLYQMMEMTPEQQGRLKELQEKEYAAIRLPEELFRALMRQMGWFPSPRLDVGIWTYMNEYGGSGATNKNVH